MPSPIHNLQNYTSIQEAYKSVFFNVAEEPLYRMSTDATTGKRVFIKVPQKAITRADTSAYLGSVGEHFKTLQPLDQLKTFEPLLTSGYFELKQGLALQGGKKIVIQVGLKNSMIDVTPNDPVHRLLSIVQGLDGSLAIATYDTNIRVVCLNTLKMSLTQANESGRILKIRHTQSAQTRLSNVSDLLKNVVTNYAEDVARYRTMASTKVSSANLKAYFSMVLNTDSPRTLEKLTALHDQGRGANQHTRGTVWGAYNAVTEYLDHERGRNQDSGITSSWFGPSAQVRNRAYEAAIDAEYTVLA